MANTIITITIYYHEKNFSFIYFFIIYILIESINTDLISFKILWIVAAILVSIKQKQKIINNS